jgi:hypothetical protein
MADANYANVVIETGFNGAAGKKVLLDTSPQRKAIVLVGSGAQIVNGGQKYGDACLSLTPTSYASIDSSAAFNLTGKDFTIELWFYGTTNLNNIALLSRCQYGGSQGWGIQAGRVRGYMNGAWNESHLSWGIPSQNVWHHLAVCGQGTTITAYLDGQLVSTKTGVTSIGDEQQAVRIGVAGSDLDNPFTGLIDDVRYTVGVCRYTANFTPPTEFLDESSLVKYVKSPVPLTLRQVTAVAPTFKKYSGAAKVVDRENGGKGRIAGKVTQYGSPDTPFAARVRLHRKKDGVLARETWSADDGSYSFDYINENVAYYVVSFDHTGNFNGVIKDNITPVVIA